MNDALEKYTRLKSEVEQLQSEVDKSTGALEQLMARLKSEFGCKSIEEARKEITKLERRKKRLEKQFREGVNAFEEEWSERLDGQGD